MKLAQRFGSSVYAAAREFARTHHRPCIVFILEPIEFVKGHGARAAVRRIEPSPSFRKQFGCPDDTMITLDRALGPVLPVGLKMTLPVSLCMTDLNGDRHGCLAEAFDTSWNVLILLYPVRALTTTTIRMPGASQSRTLTRRVSSPTCLRCASLQPWARISRFPFRPCG